MAQSKRWQEYPRAPAEHFARFPDLSPLIVQILYNRSLTDPEVVENFLACRWGDNDPLKLKGMRPAVERLSQAILRQESIAVYGDYDADGVTATALMMQLLSRLGAKAQVYIPNRFDEGYGLNNEALAELAGQGVRVVVTVDCGIRSVEEVKYGRQLGLDLIITDHHHVGETVPPALAAINPKQADCTYSFKELAGVGLAYKVAQALLRSEALRARCSQAGLHEDEFIDLVALGTVADLAPLHGENRHLVERGLKKLNNAPRPGVAALLQQSGNWGKAITAWTIGFVIGPRLNAAGRLDSAMAAYRLLMAQTQAEAKALAPELDQQNQNRQALTAQMVESARQIMLADQGKSPLYLISHSEFNPGVVGLAASRLAEEFYRPVLVAEQGPEKTRGSARSIPEFHITQALDRCADLLVRYGGHAAAAGFTVRNENLPALQERLLKIAQDSLNVAELRPTLPVDGVVNLRGVKRPLVEAIIRLEPFGYGNPTPQFMSHNLRLKYKKGVGADGQHLKLVLHDGRQDWSAIAFRQGQWLNRLQVGQEIDVVYNLEFNEWNGAQQMQLNIKDLRPSQ